MLFVFSSAPNLDDKLFMESLYKEHHKMLFYIARRYIFEDGLAEDVVHDSFIKLIEKTSLLRQLDCCKLRAYLVTTVRNTAITKSSLLKAERKWTINCSEENLIEQLPDKAPSPESLLILTEEKEIFAKVISTLPERDRFLLEAKYYLKMTDQDVADILHVKPASIRMMLTRVRRKVFEEMQEVIFVDG